MALSPSISDATARSIADYDCLRLIGQGAYGQVWLARNIIGSYVALKIVERSAFEHQRPFEREFEGIKRFEPISRTDPSQVSILHVGRGEDFFYYVMELADDANSSSIANEKCSMLNVQWNSYTPRTLKRLLLDHGSLPAQRCIEFALSLTRALSHLHKNGLVHRDIKPSNVIFVNGVAKLADIGLVTSVDASRSWVGTEGYSPPEGAGTPQADIYSLGKVLYEMSTGCDRSEFPALPRDIANRADREQISELNAIVVTACQIDARNRYETVENLRKDLSGLTKGRSIKAQQRQRRILKHCVRTAALAVALFVATSVTLQRKRPFEPHSRVSVSTNREALSLYAKAQTTFGQRSERMIQQSIRFCQEALDFDPNFTRARGLLFWNQDGFPEQRDTFALLERRAPNSADTYAARAWLAYNAFDFAKADAEFRSALARDPLCAWARFGYAIFLTQCGKLKDARTQLDTLGELEPANVGVPAWRGDCYYFERDYPNAIASYRDSLRIAAVAPRPHEALAKVYEAMAMLSAAIEETEIAEILDGAEPTDVKRQSAELREALERSGPAEYWRVRVQQLQQRPGSTNQPFQFARLFARLGRDTEALDALETAWRAKNVELRFLLIDQSFDRLRTHPRYANLIQKIGFPKPDYELISTAPRLDSNSRSGQGSGP